MKKVLILFVTTAASWNPIAGGFSNGNQLELGLSAGTNPIDFNSFIESTNNVMKNFVDSFTNVMNEFTSNFFGTSGNLNAPNFGFGKNFDFGANTPRISFNFDFGKLPVDSKTFSISTDQNGMKINDIGSVASTSFLTGNLANLNPKGNAPNGNAAANAVPSTNTTNVNDSSSTSGDKVSADVSASDVSSPPNATTSSSSSSGIK